MTDSLIVELDGKVQKFEQSMNRAASATNKLDTSAKSAERGLDQFQRTSIATATASNKMSNSMGMIGRSAGQAGIQLQQFVGQIQGGQSAMLALSQQGADLGFVLGAPLAGAVVGIGASIAGFLIPQLIGASVETEELVKQIRELEEVSKRTAAQTRVLANDNEDRVSGLSKENQEIAEQIKLLEERIKKQTSAGTGTDEGTFAVPRSAEENQKRYAESISDTRKELDALRGQLDLNNQKIIEINEETSNLNSTQAEQNEFALKYTESLTKQIIALESGAQAAEVYAATQSAVAEGMEEQLPQIIEMINRKYELIEAERLLREEEKLRAEEAKERDKNQEDAIAGSVGFNEDYEARLEMLREFALTKEELLIEQYQRELEMLNEFQALTGQSDKEMYGRRLELAKDFAKDLERIRSIDEKDNKKSEDKKRKAWESNAKAAANIGELMFADNKAVRSAAAVIDTLAGINNALATQNYAAAALIAATGFANVAKINSTEKGSSGGGGSVASSAPQEQSDFQPETTNLEVTSSVEGGGSTVQMVSLTEDDIDDLSDAMARKVASMVAG